MQQDPFPAPPDELSASIDRAVKRSAALLSSRAAAQAPQTTQLGLDYSGVDAAESKLREALDGLKRPLPQPPTLRGRLGQAAIGVMRKALWWQTHLIERALDAFASSSLEQRRLVEQSASYVINLDRRLLRLESAYISQRSTLQEELRAETLNLSAAVEQMRAEIEELQQLRG
ncbi:MAG: hypothetical protein KDC27_02860 [Acidobacteria bacterium]|nr:hypothetical protein [Acidobacteriota bacterium]